MDLKNWKGWVLNKGEKVIKKRTSPLPLKELAWRGILFASKCGRSNPVSFALRPIATHRHLRLGVGINLVVIVLLSSGLATTPSLALDNEATTTPAVISLTESQISLTTQVRIKFPLPQREISQGYWLLHSGIDFRTPEGTPVNAVMSGVVSETGKDRFGYGNKVLITHGGGYESLYAHLAEIDVKPGDKVTTDSVIGKSGNTGRSTGPHLHLEIRENGRTINPALILGNK